MTERNRNRRNRRYSPGAGSPQRHPTRPGSAGVSSQGRMTALMSSFGEGKLNVIIMVFLVLVVVFFIRLVYLQVFMSDEYTAMAQETRTASFETTPRRGTIYDRNGIVLATSVDAKTIYANPSEVEDPQGTAAQLAAILGGKMEDYQDILLQPTTFAYIKRQADVDAAQQVEDLDIPGIYFINDTRREYPNGSIGGQVIGYCNVDGDGITGLELQYNDILKGSVGTYVGERGVNGTPIPGGVREQESVVDGQDIVVSLDIKFQSLVEQILEEGIADLGSKEGSAVVMDSSNGEIYAICSLPYMDPSDMQNSPVGSDQVKPITQAYEPGSVFKSVSVLGVLMNHTMAPEDTLFCPATITADEYKVSDSHERGDETFSLRDILGNSSNVGVSLAVENMGFDKLNDTIELLGLTQQTGVDYPGEAVGYMQPFSKWARITGYNLSFGQGVTVTPLQITRLYSLFANGGSLVTPHFLISKPQTSESIEYKSRQVVADSSVIDDMESMLRTVVTDGTGKTADIEGFDVVGKTSTAQIAENGGYRDGQYNLAFVGYLNNSSSNLVCYTSSNETYGMLQTTQIFHDIMSCAIDQYSITPN